MFDEKLKSIIEEHWGKISKMNDNKGSEVFLELHKSIVMLLKRDFEITDPIVTISKLNLIDDSKEKKNVHKGKGSKK